MIRYTLTIGLKPS